MKPRRQMLPHFITVLAIGMMALTIIFLMAQNREQGQRTEKLSQEIKRQTDINQRYLRCILLIEREKFTNVELRVDAIDKCAIESKLPNGEPSGTQPTTEQRENFESQPKQEEQEHPRASQPPQTNGPTPTTPATPQSSPSPAPSQQQAPQPEPSVIDRVTQPVTGIVERIL